MEVKIMLYVLCGFLFGCLIPCFARRLGKLISYPAGYVWLKIFVPFHALSFVKLKENPQYMHLFYRYLMRSLGWGIFCAAVTWLFIECFDNLYTVWYLAFLWIMLLLVEVDKRFMLLPDVLTLPLLILGFGYAAIGGNWLITSEPEIMSASFNSFLGAVFGYVMPTFASMFIVWKYPDAFGGGDIKLLAAIGAWVGFEATSYIILLSCVIFAVQCLIAKQKDGAFGPAIVYATIITQIFLQGFE